MWEAGIFLTIANNVNGCRSFFINVRLLYISGLGSPKTPPCIAAEATKSQPLFFNEQEGRRVSGSLSVLCHCLCFSFLNIHSSQALSSLPQEFKIHCPRCKKHSLKCPFSSSSPSSPVLLALPLWVIF